MSNQMPIYSQVLPKSQFRSKGTKTRTREFDPLNFNNGGNFSSTIDKEKEKDKEREKEKKERRSNETSRSRRNQKNEASDGKVEAYLKQYQANMRQQQNQHRHAAVRQAEHRVNLRSLPLNEVTSSRGHDRTPTDRHRGFPERERDGTREHRRERERDRDRDRDREPEFDGIPLSPDTPRDPLCPRPVRKSSSAHRVTETAISTDQRRFFCREWAFQKIAHCLEQRPHSKTNGALVIGDAGSGKTALCQELSSPGQGPQARQQRALNRRLLARHFLQSNSESSLRPGEFVRSLAMQILSHSSRSKAAQELSDAQRHADRRDSAEERLLHRLRSMGEDRDSSKPLLADSEDRTDEEESVGRRTRTIERIHEREAYLDSMMPDAELSQDPLPAVLPRRCAPASPRASPRASPPADLPLYENHENIFLRNISARSSEPRLQRQSSEPTPQRRGQLHKSLSTETNESKIDSPPKSRIPVANFRYPNKSELKSAENSPKKVERREEEKEEELPEYQNVLNEEAQDSDHCVGDGEGAEDVEDGPAVPEDSPPALEDAPPPIPSLPVSPRTLIANLYYDKLLAHPEIQQALLPQHLERSPDECFKKALLFPLLEIEPPKHCLFLLVDGIDEGNAGAESSGSGSQSVGTLLARHQHLLPQWLLLVCTTRPRPKKAVSNMFTGFRKITLDELSRAHVSADVQRYVLARLDTEPRLRARVSSDSSVAAAAAAALDHLRIKSDGCLLYLEKVLDGVADGFIALREIKEIPGTLNGLYLWLAQRLFHGKRFSKVRLLLDVLLAARCGVTEEMLYRCLLTKEYSVTRDDFNRRMHLLRRILVISAESGHVRLFHHSFASWLVDVKHCTKRYLASPSLGHGALAMYYTLTATRLSALEIHHYVFHMTQLERHLAEQRSSKHNVDVDGAVDLHTLTLLWILDSGCDVDAALRHDILQVESKLEDGDADPESEGKESLSGVCGVSGVMPALSLSLSRDACVSRDIHVTRALTALSRQPQASTLHTLLLEEPASGLSSPQPGPEEVACEPSALHDVVARGDVDTLAALLKRYPPLVESCDVNGGSALHTAARSGTAACAGALLAAGAAVDAADADGWTPLRAAAWAGHTDVLEVLLQHGCDVHAVDADSRTALRAAAWSGHVGVVSRLLAAGAAAESADAEGRTPLLAAAYMGHADIVRALLAAGASVHTTDHDGRTALSVASLCAQGAEVAALLVERGADVNKADRDKATPLIVAAFEGHTEICELLLEAEADVEATDASGRTALWAAAAAGHARAVRLLLFWGACVDNMDAEGRTVLSTAAAQGNVEVVRQLLDRGLDEHHRDNSGWTPLHYAAFEGHIEVCEALLEAGAKVDEADNDGKGALLLAAQEGHTRLCECLVDTWRAPVHQHAHDGKTALRLAALEGHFDTVSALHARGADPDAPDADRRSTLYVLALDNRLAMARYLLAQCGATVDTTDNEGRTPLHVSAWQGHTDMVNLLVKVGGAAVDARDRCMRTALHAAAWRGRGAALRALLALGADVSALCTQGATPLGIAAQEGHEECVVWLLQHGADPNKPDHAGRTPGKVAWRAGHGNICRLLERWAPAAPAAPAAPREPGPHRPSSAGSPESKRRSVHSSSSTRSSNRTAGSSNDRDHDEKSKNANLSLSFAAQVARCGRTRRERDREEAIPENQALEKDNKLDASNRSYIAHERDRDLRACERDRRRDERHAIYEPERDNASPLYASPPHSPVSDLASPTTNCVGSQPPGGGAGAAGAGGAAGDTHFNRDTHMRIILGREAAPERDSKGKRNGIVTNPAMRLVANVRNGLDNAAANIRRTGVALAASASSANPAVKSNAFQWRRETPL